MAELDGDISGTYKSAEGQQRQRASEATQLWQSRGLANRVSVTEHCRDTLFRSGRAEEVLVTLWSCTLDSSTNVAISLTWLSTTCSARVH